MTSLPAQAESTTTSPWKVPGNAPGQAVGNTTSVTKEEE